jgi:hypothetical protein
MYTVIFPSGRIMTFYVESVARMYAKTMESKPGMLITPQILNTLKRMQNV